MSLFSEVRERARALLFPHREDRELEEELDFHLKAAVEENLRRGLDPREARRAASLELGGLDGIKEEVREARGTRAVEDLARDVRFACRRLLKEPGFTTPAVTTIALGIGVATAVLAMVNGILLKPLPYIEAGRLVEVRHAAPRAELAVTGLSPGMFVHYEQRNRSLDGLGVYLDYAQTLTDGGAPEQVRVASVSPSLFNVLRATPHLGRLPSTADLESGEPSGLIISHDLWRRRYGADPEIIGRAIEIGREREVVSGVMRPGFHFPHPETQVWRVGPIVSLLDRFGHRADIRSLYLKGVARLEPSVTLKAAERDLDRLIRGLPQAFPDVTSAQIEQMGLHAEVTPLRDVIVGDVRPALLLLAAAAAFLLFITWSNVINLTLLRADRLRKEVAVQRALGATGSRFAQRFLTESFLLAGAGAAVGLAFATWAVDLRFGFETDQIPRLGEVRVDGAVAGVALALALVTAVLLTVAAYLGVRRRSLESTLTGSFGRITAGRSEQTARRFIVATQVALALTLLIGSALMARSYWRLGRVELGFETESALTFYVPLPSDAYSGYDSGSGFHTAFLERIRALPGVDAAGAATISAFPLVPVPEYYITRVSAGDVQDTISAPFALYALATPGYFGALGVPLIQGHTFDDVARGATPGVILSAALARTLFGYDNPVGQRVRLSNVRARGFNVIGVVGGVPSRTLQQGASNVVYFPNMRAALADSLKPPLTPTEEQYVVRTSVPPASLVSAVRRNLDDLDPKLAMLGTQTLDDLVAESLAPTRLTLLLLLAGSATALCLGLIGIYGVLSYAVRQRGPEFGVRIALGADPASVVSMIVRQGAVLALCGIAGGLIAAFALTRYMGSFLYGVSPSDPLTFAIAPALLFSVAVLASYLPARRAGRTDPIAALKAE